MTRNELITFGFIHDLITRNIPDNNIRCAIDNQIKDAKQNVSEAIWSASEILSSCIYELKSPIEQIMFGLLLDLDVPNVAINFSAETLGLDMGCGFGEHSEKSPLVDVCPQFPIPPYVADFVLFITAPGVCGQWAIECDGHDFHEKTKEQVSADKKRDRYIQKEGYRILRFSGSEIWRDPHAIKKEIESDIKSFLAKEGQQ